MNVETGFQRDRIYRTMLKQCTWKSKNILVKYVNIGQSLCRKWNNLWGQIIYKLRLTFVIFVHVPFLKDRALIMTKRVTMKTRKSCSVWYAIGHSICLDHSGHTSKLFIIRSKASHVKFVKRDFQAKGIWGCMSKEFMHKSRLKYVKNAVVDSGTKEI